MAPVRAPPPRLDAVAAAQCGWGFRSKTRIARPDRTAAANPGEPAMACFEPLLPPARPDRPG